MHVSNHSMMDKTLLVYKSIENK